MRQPGQEDPGRQEIFLRRLPGNAFGRWNYVTNFWRTTLGPVLATGPAQDVTSRQGPLWRAGMAIARYPTFVADCPDADALAAFYGELLDWTVKVEDGWVEIRPEDGRDCISFQEVTDYRAPEWAGQVVPQQIHLDLVVADLDECYATWNSIRYIRVSSFIGPA